MSGAIERRAADLADTLIEIGEAYRSIGRPLLELAEAEAAELATGRIHEVIEKVRALTARAEHAAGEFRRLHRTAAQDPNR